MDGQKAFPHCDASNIEIVNPQGFFRETLQRLPLADAVYHLLGYALHDSFLSACYEKHRGHGYEDILSFAKLVEIMTDALLVHQGSARQRQVARVGQCRLCHTRGTAFTFAEERTM